MGTVIGTVIALSGAGIIMVGTIDYRLLGWVFIVVGAVILGRAQQKMW